MTFKLFIAGLIAAIIFALYSGNQRKKQARSKEMRDEISKMDLRHAGGDVWEDPTADDSPDLCSWEEENRLSDEVIEMDRRAAEEIMGTAAEGPARVPVPANPGGTEDPAPGAAEEAETGEPEPDRTAPGAGLPRQAGEPGAAASVDPDN